MLRNSENESTAYIDSDSNLGFYIWANKEGVQVEIMKDLYLTLIDKHLIDKNPTATQWFLNFKDGRIGELDMRQFIDIFKEISVKHLS
jgi:hypothetical protein